MLDSRVERASNNYMSVVSHRDLSNVPLRFQSLLIRGQHKLDFNSIFFRIFLLSTTFKCWILASVFMEHLLVLVDCRIYR